MMVCDCSNAFVDDCVEYFYSKRVLDVPRLRLKPVRKMSSRPPRYSLSDLPSRQPAPPADGASGDGRFMNRKPPYRAQPQRGWQRSGMRCGNAGDGLLDSAAGEPGHHPQIADEPPPRMRRPRFHPELDNKVDTDQVLSFLDQMDIFNPSKSRVEATNAVSSPSASSSDLTKHTPEAGTETPELLSLSGDQASVGEPETEFCENDRAVSPQPSNDADNDIDIRNTDITTISPLARLPLDTTPPIAVSSAVDMTPHRAGSPLATTPLQGASSDVPRIPETIAAWQSLSSEASMMMMNNDDDDDDDDDDVAEPLHSSPLEPVGHGTPKAVHHSPEVIRLKKPPEPTPDNLPTSITPVTSSSSYRRGGIRLRGGRSAGSELRSSVLSPVCHSLTSQWSSPSSFHTPRLLSANASSVYFEQKEGDVIVESDEEGIEDNWT